MKKKINHELTGNIPVYMCNTKNLYININIFKIKYL